MNCKYNTHTHTHILTLTHNSTHTLAHVSAGIHLPAIRRFHRLQVLPGRGGSRLRLR